MSHAYGILFWIFLKSTGFKPGALLHRPSSEYGTGSDGIGLSCLCHIKKARLLIREGLFFYYLFLQDEKRQRIVFHIP